MKKCLPKTIAYLNAMRPLEIQLFAGRIPFNVGNPTMNLP